MKVGYEEARKRLLKRTVMSFQRSSILRTAGRLLNVGIELLDDIQKLVESRGAKKLRLKFSDKTVAEYPVALTAAVAFIVVWPRC